MFIFTENYARSTNITHFLKDYPVHINVIVILIFITSTQFVLTSKVRILGLFCFCLFTFLVVLGRILLWAIKTLKYNKKCNLLVASIHKHSKK